MTERPSLPAGLVRRLFAQTREKPIPEMVHVALRMVRETMDVRAAFVAHVDDHLFEVLHATGEGVEQGVSLALEDSFASETGEDGIVNVGDAARRDPYRSLPMRRMFSITSYLGVPIYGLAGRPFGTLAVVGRHPRIFGDGDTDLLMMVSAILGPRLDPNHGAAEPARTPLSVLRLASHEVKEPLAILRGYADMLSRGELPPDQLALVARRLALQSETLIRVVDQMLIIARLPMELAFTVRVSLDAVVQGAAERVRPQMEARGVQFRVQLDTTGDVWGDPMLLEAALDEMLANTFKHAPNAGVVQLRLRRPAPERLQVIVKDDGPGISADRLADLFKPLRAGEEPAPGTQGVGLFLLRRVAQVHGGSAWANSLEGKGTTFYLELPAASPDGDSARASQSAGQAPA